MAEKTVRGIHANRGVEAKYRKEMQKLISEMHGSVSYWLKAAYRKEPPNTLALVEQAQDASPTKFIIKTLNGLAIRWKRKFKELSEKIAKSFVTRMFSATDTSFKNALKDVGWSVNFKMTPAMRDAFNASIEANVGLIRSIPDRYLQQVEGVVMRAYSNGRDLETMTKDLQKLYPISSRRAETIARDQANKANSVVTKTRELELSITEAYWMHSHAGKNPRQPHVWADKKKFNIAQGMLIDGEYIQPGEKINCRCTKRAILPF